MKNKSDQIACYVLGLIFAMFGQIGFSLMFFSSCIILILSEINGVLKKNG